MENILGWMWEGGIGRGILVSILGNWWRGGIYGIWNIGGGAEIAPLGQITQVF